MNEYFYKVWVPLQIITVIAFLAIGFSLVQLNWVLILISWFLIGPVGMGVGFHRLFAHRQFQTWPWVEKVLAVLGTFAAYSPLLFFAAQHQYHHKTSDSAEDPSSPVEYGFWESFLTWRMRKGVMKAVHTRNKPVRTILRDRFLLKISKNFAYILYGLVVILLLVGPFWLVNLFIVPVFLEHLRINVISSLSHMDLPFNYRLYDTMDKSQNNIVIGLISCGFGWHNSHHARPRKMLSQEKWWEIDLEGYIAWMLDKLYKLSI